MRRALRTDVARWQAGQLDAEQLRARHPGEAVDDALAAHAALGAFAHTPAPDTEQAWSRVAAALPARPAAAPARRLRRSVVAAIIAAVTAGPALAYAAAPDAVRSGIGQVTDLFTDDADKEPRRADPEPVVEPGVTDEGPGAEPGSTDPEGRAEPAGSPALGDDADDDGAEAPSTDADEPDDDTAPGGDDTAPDDAEPDADDPARTDELETGAAPPADGYSPGQPDGPDDIVAEAAETDGD